MRNLSFLGQTVCGQDAAALADAEAVRRLEGVNGFVASKRKAGKLWTALWMNLGSCPPV